MAHGFLTPQAVSGESPLFKKLYNAVGSLLEKKIFPLSRNQKVIETRVTEIQNLLKGGNQKALPPAATKMLGGSKIKGLLPGAGAIVARKAGIVNTQAKTDIVCRNATDIDRKEQRYLGTTDPDVAGGPRTRKGGTFTDFGSTAQAKPLNDTNFFSKAVNEGVDANTGEYLSKEARIAAFQKGKVARNPDQGAPPITPDSGADIVAAVNRNTEVIVRLADLTKEQTVSQKSMHNEQQAHADKLANRALARGEEKSLEKGSDLSGFLAAERYARLPGAGGTGGGRGDGPGMGIGGKAATGALVKAVGKRGAQRVGTRLAAKYGGKAAAKAAGKYGGKAAAKLGLGGAAKIGAGAIAKSAGKKIPLVGLGLGAIFAAQRALEGDFVGAGLELASGAASTVPGIGTAGCIGIDAALAARDMGMTPFARGGIITEPTNALMGEAGKEGVFPLEGKRGKDTFLMMGEGILEAQRKAKQEYADLQSLGLKRYFQEKDGFKAFGKALEPIFETIFGPLVGGLMNKASNFLGGVFNNLFGTGRQQNNLSPVANTGGLADFIGGLESGNDYTKMVGGAQDASVLNKTIDELMSEKGGQFAMGRYQIQMRTASEVLKNAGIDTSSFKFDQAGQDKIFELLLKRRGIDDFMSGKISEDQFAKNLSMEWAALPEDASGKGYYDGVGPNKSLTSYSSVMGQLSALKSSGSPFQATAPGAGGQNLAAAAQSLRGMSTADGPDGGVNGCVYAVNKVFNKAGITPPWGSSLYVPDAEKSMIDAGWQQVPYNQMQPGDVFVMKDQKSPPQAHIGVATDSKMILSNSSGKASMSWSSTAEGYNSYYGGVGALYRMPGQQAVSTAQAGSPGAPPTPPKREDFATGRAGAKAFSEAKKKFAATSAASPISAPSPIAAAPAAPNTGTPIMATSAQVASASTAPAAAPTIINNYYGGGNNGGQMTPNAVAAGISMDSSGTAAFQELKLRSLG